MNTKRIIALLIAAIMVLSMIPVMAVSTSAAGEGMWTTYRGAGSYPAIDDEPDPDGEETIYPPEAGYEYTSDGFSMIAPDWSGVGPFSTASTTEQINLKDGLYLEFRVDDYSYGGEVGAAFLGSQGDLWDAQKDMLCDTLGAILASLIFPLCVRLGFVKK